MTSSTPMLIYQNIFRNSSGGGMWWNFFDNGATDPTWIRVFNNTFVNNPGGAGVAALNNAAFKAGTHGLFWNNIVYGGDVSVRMDTTDLVTNTQKDRFDFDHNVYFGSSVFGDLAGAGRTFQAWQGLGQDLAGVVADPLFVSSTDLRLRADSPARNVGRAVYNVGGTNGATIPAGAYITGSESIGPTAGYTPPVARPSAPRNLRVRAP
ncbi:MAG: hypothetical protein ACKVPX_01210 [Myxococcaceae bacterium]